MHGTPACVTPRVTPAIVNVALRVIAVAFAAAVNPTVPLPLPLEPLVIVIHDASRDAVHVQPVGAVTENVLAPPAANTDRLDGETPNAQVRANEKPFDGVLEAEPPGPTAAIRTSYVVPPAGIGLRIVVSGSRIVPVAPGVGFPSETTRRGVDAPAA